MEKDRISDVLRDEREKRKISIEEITEKTRIPLKYIQLLEKGEWEKFPSKVHLLGYMKLYCEYIGLEEKKIKEILSVFKNEEKEEEKEIENYEDDKDIKGKREKILLIILPLIFLTIYFLAFYLLSEIGLSN